MGSFSIDTSTKLSNFLPAIKSLPKISITLPIESILNKHLNCFFKAYTESPGFIFSFTSIREIVTLFLPTAKTNPLALSSIFTSS